ncbi:hypothetical protein BU24DRAFT_169412 [Aaosphaeria arxii CBS 175.79]|uniref:Uncharacterized protein n=1 Tax=Aaosphaeria arxii CBS 175.79 TaxID=1450172 RepID=A0A6A5Y0P7_9PLEO|nr:uncharacterized protein BU24DRAFT_169412 [Aaosphaeria arxii CBS 175.79]KAF2018370.1 hypothetical protein BU24DRAFT_169412 [Aaosphaeria arxii CBS 175.79]
MPYGMVHQILPIVTRYLPSPYTAAHSINQSSKFGVEPVRVWVLACHMRKQPSLPTSKRETHPYPLLHLHTASFTFLVFSSRACRTAVGGPWCHTNHTLSSLRPFPFRHSLFLIIVMT